jgi:hypothetical protein
MNKTQQIKEACNTAIKKLRSEQLPREIGLSSAKQVVSMYNTFHGTALVVRYIDGFVFICPKSPTNTVKGIIREMQLSLKGISEDELLSKKEGGLVQILDIIEKTKVRIIELIPREVHVEEVEL